ncbi:hypothetical protein [Miltoncostaea oceani]|uniref:hypothetical protein n=1 Tax=Miltoncostaea oceani TaxID=2843216 RepID=UPI001C3E74C4|nr:hypothetical protein [Miltoncostaea oceani]
MIWTRTARLGLIALAALIAAPAAALGANSISISGPAEVRPEGIWPFTVNLDDDVGGVRVGLRQRAVTVGPCGLTPAEPPFEYGDVHTRLDVTAGPRSYSDSVRFNGNPGPRFVCAYAFDINSGAVVARASTQVMVLPAVGTLSISAPAVVSPLLAGTFTFTLSGTLEPGALRYLLATIRPFDGTPCARHPAEMYVSIDPFGVSGNFSTTKTLGASPGRQLICAWLGFPDGPEGPTGQGTSFDPYPVAVAQAVVDVQTTPPVAPGPRPRAAAPKLLRATVTGRTVVARYRVTQPGQLTVRLIGRGANRVIARRYLETASTVTVRYTRSRSLRPGAYRISAVYGVLDRRVSLPSARTVRLR